MFRLLYGVATRSSLFLAATFLISQLLSPTATAQKAISFPRVTRGAYLQMLTPSSVIIRWRTAQATSSFVRYGTDPGNLESIASSPGQLKDHVVLVSGLTPAAQYYYSVGSSNRVLQSGPENYFVTAPVPDSTPPVRIWVLGDPGTGWAVQRAVRDAYLRTTGPRRTDLVLTLGDNAYHSGTDAQYQDAFFDVYRDLFKHCVVWPALGNHDARSASTATESGVYYNIFSLPRLGQAGGTPSGTQAYYSFDYANVHFVCLNSQDSDLSTNAFMVPWLRRDLASNRKEWTVAYWHHPPYSKGSHDSDDPKEKDNRMFEMRRQVLPVLEKGGVDLVLCGHSHLYERSFLIRGYFGDAGAWNPSMVSDRGNGRPEGAGAYKTRSGPNRGTVFVTTGSAGHATKPKELHGLNHPAMAVSLNVPGSFVLDIQGRQLQGTFVDDTGERRDSFAVLHW